MGKVSQAGPDADISRKDRSSTQEPVRIRLHRDLIRTGSFFWPIRGGSEGIGNHAFQLPERHGPCDIFRTRPRQNDRCTHIDTAAIVLPPEMVLRRRGSLLDTD